MECPQCGLEQPEDAYCVGCGLNVKKYNQNFWHKIQGHALLSLGVLILVGVGVVFWFMPESSKKQFSSEFQNTSQNTWKKLAPVPKKSQKPSTFSDETEAQAQASDEDKTELRGALSSEEFKASQEEEPKEAQAAFFSATLQLLEIPEETLNRLRDVSERRAGAVLVSESRLEEFKGLEKAPASSYYTANDLELKKDNSFSLSNDILLMKVLEVDSSIAKIGLSYQDKDDLFEEQFSVGLDSAVLVPLLDVGSAEKPMWMALWLKLHRKK